MYRGYNLKFHPTLNININKSQKNSAGLHVELNC